MRLKAKVCIVTGGASGFGEGIVRCMAAEGATVVIVDLNQKRAQQLAEELRGHSAEACSMEADVTHYDAIKEVIDRCVQRYGRLDVLVNNAGLGQRPMTLEETSDAVFEQQFAVNVRGVFYGCKAALPVFKKQASGCIINTASGIALTPRPNLVIYGATKGAVVTLTKGLAMELAPQGIRVNALCPAAGDTPMLTEFMGGELNQTGRDKFTASIPLGRLINGQDMGAAAVYLASDEAAMITGTCLPVDGGRCI